MRGFVFQIYASLASLRFFKTLRVVGQFSKNALGINDHSLNFMVFWVSQKQGKNIIINYNKTQSIIKIINKDKIHFENHISNIFMLKQLRHLFKRHPQRKKKNSYLLIQWYYLQYRLRRRKVNKKIHTHSRMRSRYTVCH